MRIALALILLLSLTPLSGGAQPAETFIQEAQAAQAAGDLPRAIEQMRAAVAAAPDDADAHAYLGLYLGRQAGEAEDFMAAGQLIDEAFATLDKATALDPGNLRARLYRGILSVRAPEFLGHLDQGILDLETVIAAREPGAPEALRKMYVQASLQLGFAYPKRGRYDDARARLREVIMIAPNTEQAGEAQALLAQIEEQAAAKKAAAAPAPGAGAAGAKTGAAGDAEALLAQARDRQAAGEVADAEALLREALEIDPGNLAVILLLVETLGMQAGEGYDDRIAQDTDLRTNLAFEIARLADQAVRAAPEDPQARLVRGMIDVQMPFFVGKIDQGIEDLQFILEHEAPAPVKTEALYWLGLARRKQGTTRWIEIVTDHPESEAARRVFADLRPESAQLGAVDVRGARVAIEFMLGFQDELPPQLAVWIEDAAGRYVRTLFVSGFAGHVRDHQITLPVWAETTQFVGIEGVTGASIDRGHYRVAWDLRDADGVPVEPGTYGVKAEVHFWPSMQYQLAEGEVEIGGGRIAQTVEKGDLIPYLAIAYVPEDQE